MRFSSSTSRQLSKRKFQRRRAPNSKSRCANRLKGGRARRRMERMGISDPKRIYRAKDLAPGNHIVFTACGVTAGPLLNGVRFFGEGYRTHSIVMTMGSQEVRFIDSVHMTRPPGLRGVRLY